MRILQLANFVSPTSGGIKTALGQWARRYRAEGHTVGAIVPATGDDWAWDTPAQVRAVGSWPLPGSAGYRLMTGRAEIAEAIAAFRPDVLEISDRTTLRWVPRWARARGIACVMVAHENVTDVARTWGVPRAVASAVANGLNAASAAGLDAVVTPSAYAASEFRRIGVPAHVVPLGVDRGVFRPRSEIERGDGAPARRSGGPLHLVHVGRLSQEKYPFLSVKTLVELVLRDVDAELTIVGDGPHRERVARAAAGFPVELVGHRRPDEVAAILRDADVVLAPAPAETFGLAALEAMACGVPVVCGDTGALAEVVGDGGRAVPAHATSFANAVVQLAGAERAPVRERALARAEGLTWEASAHAMLRVHAGVLGHHLPAAAGA
ncbi:glycosyl transferase [Serinibacter arcticus]|uniref:D-inositol 3-phosphate glycosyltransferase n=1 Tax=Serinibacter arcticus TaxID=1655435 RepID=A0A2U1ZTM7_9MICO|nr:glycosyltransferase [Serinibacter arcticus]PWD50300.1 glycosyl transferase [Serinibacter arcticus]